MNYTQSLQYIHSLLRFGSRPGLERIAELLKRLGDPQNQLNIIHVAGTNGKGSTCTFISNILRSAGFKTGLYISPFVTVFNERIQINGEVISDTDLAKYTERVKRHVDEMHDAECPITEFEFITAVAFLYFAEQNCDAVVLEVGLGGRLDATNVIKAPKVSVITKIALDHTGILGETEKQIAYEKCGIIKSGCPTVTFTDNSREALNVIESVASERRSELFLCDTEQAKVVSADFFGTVFEYLGNRYEIRLPGRHQVSNAANAITAVKTAYPDITEEKIKKGFLASSFAARCEVISREPLVLLDGSHNPNGTAALSELLKSANIKNATAIVGFMADKDVLDALQKLCGVFKRIITVKVSSNSRTMSAEDLERLCFNICDDVTSAQSYEDAVEKAKLDSTIVVFGSLYLAGDIRPLLKATFSDKKQ